MSGMALNYVERRPSLLVTQPIHESGLAKLAPRTTP